MRGILRDEHRLGVFENRVLRKTCESTKDEVTGKWRRVYGEKLLDFHTSLNIYRLIKSRRMRWAEHMARMGNIRKYTEFQWRNQDNLNVMKGQD